MSRALRFALLAVLLPATARAQSWRLVTSGTTAGLRSVSAVSGRIAWAGGSGGTVLRTTDGGAHWSRLPVAGADSLDFRSLHAFDSLRAVIASAGQPARIYRTEDGGRHWSLAYQDPHPGAFFDAMAFWDERRGLIMSDPVEGHWLILRTEDGGRSWTPVPADQLPPALPSEGGFAASNSCLTVADTADAWFATGGAARSRIFRSHDGGAHWKAADVPIAAGNASSGIFGLAFTDSTNGVAVGGDYRRPGVSEANVAVTRDGGATWQSAAPFRPTGLASGAVVVPGSSGTVVAVGAGGSAYSLDAGASWTPFDSTEFNAASFAGPGAGWAVGPRGRIARLEGAVPSVAPSTHPPGEDAHE